MGQRSGFTLLESIVALSILSVGLMAAFAWFERDIDALHRVERVALESVAINHAVEQLTAANLTTEVGEISWGEFVVRWRTAPLEQRYGRTEIGLLGYHDVYLLEAELSIFHSDRFIARQETILTRTSLVRPPPEEPKF